MLLLTDADMDAIISDTEGREVAPAMAALRLKVIAYRVAQSASPNVSADDLEMDAEMRAQHYSS